MNKYMFSFFIIVLSFLTAPSFINAANENIHVNVNEKIAQTDASPFIQKGTTFVPLRIIEKIPELTITEWNNKTKKVVIKDEDQSELILQVGQSVAQMEGVTLSLAQPPVIKNGRVMVPIRFIAEAFNSDVAWNSHTQTVYVAKINVKTKETLNGKNVNEARVAALSLPKISTLPMIEPDGNSISHLSIYFPKGESKQFFTAQDGVISAFKVGENAALHTWSGKISEGGHSKSLFFLPNQSINYEVGTRPSIYSDMTFYDIATHAGQATYGFIDQEGNRKEVGSQEMSSLNDLFPIEEEERKSSVF